MLKMIHKVTLASDVSRRDVETLSGAHASYQAEMDGGGHLQLHAVPCLVPPPVRTSCQRSAILPPRSREYACNLRSCKQLKIHVPRSSMIKCPFHMIAAQVDAWISGIFRS